MDDLVQFVTARLDEEEAEALSALDQGNGCSESALDTLANLVHDVEVRTLRTVEANRRSIELHRIVHREIGWLENGVEASGEIPVCGYCVPKHSHYQQRGEVPEGPCRTVRLLAANWIGHPEYREASRP